MVGATRSRQCAVISAAYRPSTRPARLRAPRFGAAGLRCYSRECAWSASTLGERRIGVAVSDASATLARPLKTHRAWCVRRRRGRAAPRDDCGPRGRRRSRLGRRRAADAARRIAQPADGAHRHDGGAALGPARGSGLHAGRAAVEPRSRGAVVAPRKGLAEAEGEARRGGRGGDPAGLPRCSIPDREEGRGQREESDEGETE